MSTTSRSISRILGAAAIAGALAVAPATSEAAFPPGLGPGAPLPPPNGVPMPPGGMPPLPPGIGPGAPIPPVPPRGPFWQVIHHPNGSTIFVRPVNPANAGPTATHIFNPVSGPGVGTRPLPFPPAGGAPAAGGMSTLGILGIAVAIAVVGTVVITGVNDWAETGNPAQTWCDIYDGFQASAQLQALAPGSHGVWDNLGDDFVNNFWGPGQPFGGGKPPAMTVVSPGQPAFTYNPGRGNAWGPGFYCLCPQGSGWGNCGVTYTIPRCADEDPYAGDCAAFLPGFVKNDPPYCSSDPSSDTYRCLRQWCRRGFNAPSAEPRFTCMNLGGCD
jgi:hypothetical protein